MHPTTLPTTQPQTELELFNAAADEWAQSLDKETDKLYFNEAFFRYYMYYAFFADVQKASSETKALKEHLDDQFPELLEQTLQHLSDENVRNNYPEKRDLATFSLCCATSHFPPEIRTKATDEAKACLHKLHEKGNISETTVQFIIGSVDAQLEENELVQLELAYPSVPAEIRQAKLEEIAYQWRETQAFERVSTSWFERYQKAEEPGIKLWRSFYVAFEGLDFEGNTAITNLEEQLQQGMFEELGQAMDAFIASDADPEEKSRDMRWKVMNVLNDHIPESEFEIAEAFLIEKYGHIEIVDKEIQSCRKHLEQQKEYDQKLEEAGVTHRGGLFGKVPAEIRQAKLEAVADIWYSTQAAMFDPYVDTEIPEATDTFYPKFELAA